MCFRTGLWRITCFRTVGIFTCTLSNRFTSGNDVFVRMASWHALFRTDLFIFVRFHTEDIVIIGFSIFHLCFRTDLWRVPCFHTAGLFTYTLSDRFASWNYAFLQTASSLLLFRQDFFMFVLFRIESLSFRTGLWRAACFRTAGLLIYELSNRFASWNKVFEEIDFGLILDLWNICAFSHSKNRDYTFS